MKLSRQEPIELIGGANLPAVIEAFIDVYKRQIQVMPTDRAAARYSVFMTRRYLPEPKLFPIIGWIPWPVSYTHLEDYARTNFPESYALAKEICRRMERELKRPVPRQEVGFLGIHIQRVAMDRGKTADNRKTEKTTTQN